MIKIIDDLRQPDFVGHPVWRYVRYDSRMVEPVAQIPVADLEECIVGTLVSLANGSRHFAMVSNIDAHRPERNAHFVGLTFFRDDKRFFLRRYHDVGYDSRGPVALAAFLGLTVSDIFPIAYDVVARSFVPPISHPSASRCQMAQAFSSMRILRIAEQCSMSSSASGVSYSKVSHSNAHQPPIRIKAGSHRQIAAPGSEEPQTLVGSTDRPDVVQVFGLCRVARQAVRVRSVGA